MAGFSARGSARIRRDESGQSIIEYMLVLFVAVLMAAALAKFSKSAWNQGVLGLGGRLEQAYKTGRAPASAWKN
jgi:Flp pilus assembly pilin Flp